MDVDESGSSSDDDSDVAFASIDFSGVDFGGGGDGDNDDDATPAPAPSTRADEITVYSNDEIALSIERECLLVDSYDPSKAEEDADGIAGEQVREGQKEEEGPETAAAATAGVECLRRVRDLASLLCRGEYAAALRSESARLLLVGVDAAAAAASAADDIASDDDLLTSDSDDITSFAERIRGLVVSHCRTVASAVEVELLSVAAFNLFLQVNYTGPSLDERGIVPTEPVSSDGGRGPLEGINPHEIFCDRLKATSCDPVRSAKAKESNGSGRAIEYEQETKDALGTDDLSEEKSERPGQDTSMSYHNAVLSELSVDGDWPCQVVRVPYMLLLARSLLLALALPDRATWSDSVNANAAASDLEAEVAMQAKGAFIVPDATFAKVAAKLAASQLWSGRAVVAHQRLLQGDEPSATLWDEVRASYAHCISSYCDDVDGERRTEDRLLAARIMLEWGLAQHHFEREGKGKEAFDRAKDLAGLQVQVTGAEGRRTKFQQKATAQIIVRARPSAPNATPTQKQLQDDEEEKKGRSENGRIKSQMMIEHEEEGVLLERIKFEDEEENRHNVLSHLELSILLALCLDVKNTNPMDGLTGEQMGGYLERILHQHDDWMIYATALLERAWLECERTHARERAILQIQALADQHTNRLTLTQSTFKAAMEDSAPPQERLRNLHCIVYPPRWSMLRDLAERYAKIGIVSSAAEIFEELELWDEVVECYRVAGKESRAEKIVRKRLAVAETPRMWAALGDLTKDPKCFERSLELSNGRFSSAHVALGMYYFEKGDLRASSSCFKSAVKVKPLQPAVWFRLGTVSMRLGDWETALNAFTEVVQQEPEEGDAWANVAAIHMHNKNPSAAYPALVESLKHKRNNWRVWVSKLYTCIDLEKYDEAIQACHQLLDFRMKKNASEEIPPLEEKCVRAIVGGSLASHEEAVKAEDTAAIDSRKRTLRRVRELLGRLGSIAKSEPWIWETSAYFNARVGLNDEVLEDLMKEYRSLQSIRSWETDEKQMTHVCRVVTQISELHKNDGSKESLVKCRFLINGVTKKIRAAHFDREIPEEAAQLEQILAEIEDLIAAK